jgi:hypothetical protein
MCGADLGAFQGFVSALTALPSVRRALTLELVKDEPLVPVDEPAAVDALEQPLSGLRFSSAT